MASVYGLFKAWIDAEEEYHKELVQLYKAKDDAQMVADKMAEHCQEMTYFIEKMSVI